MSTVLVATDSKTRSADVGISFAGMVNRLALTCKRSIVSMAWNQSAPGLEGKERRPNISTAVGKKSACAAPRVTSSRKRSATSEPRALSQARRLQQEKTRYYVR